MHEQHSEVWLSRYYRLVENDLECIAVVMSNYLRIGAKCRDLLAEQEELSEMWVMCAPS